MQTRESGFSFIEVLVVIVIISILATTVGVMVLRWPGMARITATKEEISRMKVALQTYYVEQGHFPTQEQGLQALCQVPTIQPVPQKYPEGGYLDSLNVPKDKWGHDYAYFIPARGGKQYEIVSYGSDGEPGGSGEAADISSLEL